MSDQTAIQPAKTFTRVLLGRIWRDYIRQHAGLLVIAAIFMILAGASLGAVSYLVKPLFDQVLIGKDRNAMFWVGALVCGLFTLRGAASFIQRIIVLRTGLHVVADIQTDLVSHLLKLDDGFYAAHSPGHMIDRVRGDAQALQAAAGQMLITFGRDTSSLISLLAVALWIDAEWALIAFIGVPLFAFPISRVHRYVRKKARRAREVSAGISRNLDELFHGMRAIKLNGIEEHQEEKFNTEIVQFRTQQFKADRAQAGLPALVDIVAAFGFFGVVVYAGGEIISGEKTPGEFMSFFTAMALVFDPLRRLSNISGQLQMALASLERLYTLFDTQTNIEDNGTTKIAADVAARSDIVFDNVAFRYTEQPVLQGLSFTAKAGQTTALVGPSGAGKSTVFSLLARLIEPQGGAVRIGNTNLADMPLANLRAQLATVSQDAALFDESIEYNIALGALDADAAKIQAAAEAAYVTEFSNDQADGLQTIVGARGANLSGGQRQRVVIARAFLRDAPILLLDEPTSALDAASEQRIRAALSSLSKDRTTLVIAHRLSTIQDAHQIVVIDQGRVVDTGTHQQLLERGGLYSDLYRMQFRED